ncbi:hypothetical protein U1Q18_010309 [Sarracenia purpurea var. burkii]
MLKKLAEIISRKQFQVRFPLIGKLIKTQDDIEEDRLDKAIQDSIKSIIKNRKEQMIDGEEKDANGLKIADFGCSTLAKIDDGVVTFSGTPVFMAPEVACGIEQEFLADIWALGCTVIKMATGSNTPWPELNDIVSALYRIGFSGDVPKFPNFSKQVFGKRFKREMDG